MNKLLAFIAAFGGLTLSSAGPAQDAPFNAHREVSEAIASIRRIAMNRDKLDWPTIEARAQEQAKTARDEADLLPVYGFILGQLDDHNHSRLLPPPPVRAAYVARYGTKPIPNEIPPRALRADATEGRPVGGSDLALPTGKVARLVNLPGMNGPDADGAYAGAVYTNLTKAPAACGYIVDLREDTGGNMFPMVAGLSPLLGDGYRMVVPTDTGNAPVVLEHGAATGYEKEGGPGQVLAKVPGWQDHPLMAQAPVAILTSAATASSGEDVAVQFRGRPNTRSFGATTAGQATANIPVEHSGGVVFFVTSGLFADRDGQSYPDGLRPDQPVIASPGADSVVAAARRWLAERPVCRRTP